MQEQIIQHQPLYKRFDGYLAEINLRDGEALGPESFGETKNGVWIAKNILVHMVQMDLD